MGKFATNLLSGLGSGLGGGLVGMGLNVLGQGFNALFGKSEEEKQKELMDYQQKLELERMGLQADYNKQMADYNQKNAMAMYDYTFNKQAEYNTPKAEKQRLIEAGLNPALMYGKGGAGGGSVAATPSGGQAGAVNALQPMALQVALQKKQIDMQEKLNDAQVTKTYAEAAKIAGADTRKTEADISATEAETANAKANLSLIINNAKKAKTEAEIAEATKQSVIDKAAEEYRNLSMQTNKAFVESKLAEKELDAFETKLHYLGQQVSSQALSAEAAYEQIMIAKQKLQKELQNLDTQNEKMKAEIIQGYLKIGTDIADILLNPKLVTFFTKLTQKLK